MKGVGHGLERKKGKQAEAARVRLPSAPLCVEASVGCVAQQEGRASHQSPVSMSEHAAVKAEEAPPPAPRSPTHAFITPRIRLLATAASLYVAPLGGLRPRTLTAANAWELGDAGGRQF